MICPILTAGKFACGTYNLNSIIETAIECIEEECALWGKEKKQCGFKK